MPLSPMEQWPWPEAGKGFLKDLRQFHEILWNQELDFEGPNTKNGKMSRAKGKQ